MRRQAAQSKFSKVHTCGERAAHHLGLPYELGVISNYGFGEFRCAIAVAALVERGFAAQAIAAAVEATPSRDP